MKSPIQRQLEIFTAALEHPPGPERDAFLAQACAGDDALRKCVDALLAGHRQADTFLDKPAGPVGPTGTALIPLTEKPGDRIGRYKLLQQIGEGGCGIVFMAEQEEPVRRRVALKVIKLGMDTRQVVARFEAERQALAMMDHPNIAKVLDAGATDTGRPYFVMELVRGVRLTEFCEENHLTMRQRLDLFVLVCHAVQHAHQKGIIHRDLKPSNILVTVNDGVPVPKVIDFGIAKATTGQQLTDKTLFTAFEQFMGTPAYMSPEQAVLTSLDIDTRSDIYSLGVLLYELLTGKTPFDARELWEAGVDEMRRTIREVEPVKPSTRLTLERLATSSVGSGQSEIQNLKSEIDQDLDWIVMKALEKDRARRYETANGFAADIQRHLNHEAVTARPPSLLYKFQKAVRRNKPAFAAAAAVLLALLAGLGLTAWQAVRAKNAEQTARRAEQAERAQSAQARADRDRAVLAESNATDKATAATNALLTANERMVKLNVAEGWRRVEEGDHFGALLPFAEAFALEQDKPERAELHQMRLASVLQRSPKLVNVWSVGTNISRAEFSRNGSQVIITRRLGVDLSAIYDSTTGRLLLEPADIANKRRPYLIAWNSNETRVVAVSRVVGPSIDDRGRLATRYLQGSESVQIWDASTGKPISPLFHLGADHPILYAALNPDGSKFLIAANDLSLWDAATGTNLWLHTNGAYPLLLESESVTFSPDGRSVVSGLGILDVRTGKIIATNASALFAEFSADGKRLFTAARKGWQSWAILREGNSVTQTICEWRQGAIPDSAGRFSRDGKKLATANSDSSVRIWNALDGSPHTSPMVHGSMVSDVCFSSDGAWIATCIGKRSYEGYAQVWDATTGKAITPQLPHDGPVLRVAFNRDNTQLFVVGENGTVAVWSLIGFNVPRFTWSVPGLGVHSLTVFPGERGVRLSDDGRILMVVGGRWADSPVLAWDLTTGEMRLPPVARSEDVGLVDSKLIVGGYSGKWSVVNLEDGTRITHVLSNRFRSASFIRGGHSGRWITTDQKDGNKIFVIDALDGTVSATLNCSGLANNIEGELVRQDGKQVLAVQGKRQVVCWNANSSDNPQFINMEGWQPYAYGPAGKLMVAAPLGEDSGHKVFETKNFHEVLNTNWLVENISSNDTWILAETTEGERWQILCATNDAIKSPSLTHRGTIVCGAFTADEAIAITAGTDLALRFWRVPNAESAALLVALPSEATGLWATGDGRGFVTVHADDTLRFWELPKSKRPVSDWLALARFFAKGRGDDARSADFQSAVSPISNRQGDASTRTLESTNNTPARSTPGGLQTRDTADWKSALSSFRDQWLALRAKHPEVFTVSADEIDAWHRHEAWRCESTKDWSNAVVHLSALLETHPDSGDFLPRRAAAHVAWAAELVAADVRRLTSSTNVSGKVGESVSGNPAAQTTPSHSPADRLTHSPGTNSQSLLTSAATNHWERALSDYTRTLAWVDRFPAIAKESRKPFVEKRREVFLKLGRTAEAEADERELKAGFTPPTQP